MVSSTIVFAPLQQMAVCAKLSHVQLRVTAWTVALQAPLSMGFSGQEYWCGLPCPSSGDLPDPQMELVSLTSNLHRQEVFLFVCFFTTSATWEAQQMAAQGKGQIVPLYFYYLF